MVLSVEEAKEIAKSKLGSYLTSLGININSNFQCFNFEQHSNQDRNPSMTFYAEDNSCFCHACRKRYDIFNIVSLKTGLTGKELFDYVYNMYDIQVDYSMNQSFSEKTKKIEKQQKDTSTWTNKSEYFEKCNADIIKTDYFTKRQITNPDVIKRFKLGYDEQKGFVIIPNSIYSYNARNTNPNCEKKDRYRKNPKSDGEQQIFNIDIIGKTEKPIFIVEGEFDALSIIEVGGEAIALSSTQNNDLYEYLKSHKPKKPFIIALDNDEAGKKSTKDIKEKLNEINIDFVIASASGNFKDANENLCSNREYFTQLIQQANENPKQFAYRQKSASYGLNDFVTRIQNRLNTNCFKTGFENLDEVLQGGLYSGLYVFGAISSLGKTTFAIQLADNVAKSGNDVLYFSCEMSREELTAKSISRISFLQSVEKGSGNTLAQTTMNILSGSFIKKGKAFIDSIISSISEYETFSDNLFFHEGIGTISVKEIEKAIKEHLEANDGKKPLVIIDYLQILALNPENERLTDKQCMDKTVLRLKQMSRDYEIQIFVISSFNRQSYTSPVDLSSFKESGAIEYSADVLIGMQFSGMDYQVGEKEEERNKRIRTLRQEQEKIAEKPGEYQNVQIKLLKFRNGKKASLNLELCPMFNHFRVPTKIENPQVQVIQNNVKQSFSLKDLQKK